jgi:hypothetical protein
MKSLSLKLIFLLLVWQVYLPANAQNENVVRAVIEEEDLKKLTAADEGIAEADLLMEQVNSLQTQIRAIENNNMLTAKDRKKQLDPLQSRAQQKHLQASAFYQKYHGQKFTIYKRYLDKFWKEHAGRESEYTNAKALEEQADQEYMLAAGYRIDAKRMNNGSTKMEKLFEASTLEAKSINNQLASLGACYALNEVSREPAEIAPVVALEKLPVVPPVVEAEVQKPDNTPKDSPVVVPPVAVQNSPQESVSQQVTMPVPVSGDVSYRVQLLASKVKLSKEQVAKTYRGNEPVVEMQEDGWYKYQLDGGNSLKKAQTLRQQCGITGAFIVPYRGSLKITFKEAAQIVAGE